MKNRMKANFFRCAFYVLLSVSSTLVAAEHLIVETNTFSDVKKYLEDDVLIILDIDNTLIEPTQGLGSDQWAWSRVKALSAKGVPEPEAFAQTMEEWREIHARTGVRSLESMTPEIIQDLQAKGYPMMALTTRAPEDAAITSRELHEVGIDLARTSVLDHSLELSLKRKAQFKEGILFISLDNKKGVALKEFLNKIGYHPKKLIFVDDKLSHIKDVEAACDSLDINYVGIRYAAADEHVKAFDPQIAELQRFFLHHILSDEDAALLKKEKQYE